MKFAVCFLFFLLIITMVNIMWALRKDEYIILEITKRVDSLSEVVDHQKSYRFKPIYQGNAIDTVIINSPAIKSQK